MINVLIGIFYIALVALVSYLFYYLIKMAIKDVYYELDLTKEDSKDNSYEDTYPDE